MRHVACATLFAITMGSPAILRAQPATLVGPGEQTLANVQRTGGTRPDAMAPAAGTRQAQSPGALTLRMAIAGALAHSPDLQSHADALTLADVRRDLASSEFGLKIAPSLATASDATFGAARTLGVSVSKRLTTGAQAFVNVSSYAFGSDAGLRDTGFTAGISQPLLRGFTRTATANRVSADRAATGAGRDLEVARAALVVRVTSQYVAVIKQRRLAAAARQAADRAAALTRRSVARANVGLATQLDVLRAQLLESQVTASLGAADEAVTSALDQLALLIGRPVDVPIDIAPLDTADVPPALLDVPPSSDDLVRSALAARIEIREARDRIRDSERAARVARWNLLPPVSLDAGYTRRGIGSGMAAPRLDALAGGWRVGLSTAYTVDRSAERAAAAVADLGVAAAERAAREAGQRVATEVRRLHRAWLTATSAIAIQQKAVDLAERQLQLAEIRYERGLADNFDIIDAQTSLLQARNASIATELDRLVFALDLQRAAGRLDPDTFFTATVR